MSKNKQKQIKSWSIKEVKKPCWLFGGFHDVLFNLVLTFEVKNSSGDTAKIKKGLP